jgi:hypothetical protein
VENLSIVASFQVDPMGIADQNFDQSKQHRILCLGLCSKAFAQVV